MDYIFDDQDLQLCYLPLPKGYPQSQTHCGVVCEGEKVYMTTSPYPLRKRSLCVVYAKAFIRKITANTFCNEERAEYYENPFLYIGNMSEGIPPRYFKLASSNPLMPSPDPIQGLPSFNSDPTIFLEDGTVHVLNRVTHRGKNGFENRLFHITGKIENDYFKLYGNNLLYEGGKKFISPCLVKYNEEYLLTYLDTNCYNDGKPNCELYIAKAGQIENLNHSNWKRIVIRSNSYIPWHMSLFVNNNRLYGVIACVKNGEHHQCFQMLGVFSEDLATLTIFQTPLCKFNSYRGAAFVRDDLFYLYTTTVHEKIQGGCSVDGREVLVGTKKFEDIVLKLRENDRRNGVYNNTSIQ